MVVNVIKTGASVKGPIDYSEKKVLRGLASAVEAHGIEPNNWYEIEKVFDRYNLDNLQTHNPTIRQPLLHFAVNPSETDTRDTGKLMQFMHDLIEFLGYKDQPYVIYKHFDIERGHFHVVVPRFTLDGRLIRNFGESNVLPAYRIAQFIREHGHKYDITLGRESREENKKEKLSPDRKVTRNKFFYPEASNKNDNIRYLYGYALKFNFTSKRDFGDVLRAMGLRYIEKPEADAHTRVYLQGCDKDGHPTTTVTSLRNHDGKDAYDAMVAVLEKNMKHHSKIEPAEGIKLSAVCDYALQMANSAEEFRLLLLNAGIHLTINRKKSSEEMLLTRKKNLRRTGETLEEVTSVCLVDTKERAVVSDAAAVPILDPAAINALERSGKWLPVHTPPSGRMVLTENDRAKINARIIKDTEEYNKGKSKALFLKGRSI